MLDDDPRMGALRLAYSGILGWFVGRSRTEEGAPLGRWGMRSPSPRIG